MPILIKNGLLYDGSGNPPMKRDVLIERKRIMRIGEGLKSSRETEVIDATGAFVVPGFIDIHSHSDHNLSIFSDPYQEHYIEEGITTIVGGNCGKSLFPFSKYTLATHSDWESSFASIGVEWITAKDFFSIFHEKGIGVNFGTLVGLGTVRNFITKGKYRDLTDSEFERAQYIVDEALRVGALGLSSGTEFPDETHIPSFEIEGYMKIVADYGGMYSAHLRDYGKGVLESFREAFAIARKTRVHLEVSHLDPDDLYEKEYRATLHAIERSNASAVQPKFDVSPFGERAKLCYMFLPLWAREGLREDIVEYTQLSHVRERILPSLAALPFEAITIVRVPGSISFLTGKTIADFAASLHVDGPRALLKLIEISHATALCTIRLANKSLHERFIYSEDAFIASHSAGVGFEETIYTTHQKRFKRFLKEIFDNGRVPFEKFIMKLTSYPAAYYKLGKRGLLKEGNYADVVVLRNFVPSDVLVNGVPAMRNGIIKHTRSGHMIRRKEQIRI